MQGQPHFERREIKELIHRNEMEEFLLKARDWVKGNLETVAIGALALAAAVFGAWFWWNGLQRKDLEASRLLAEAQGVLEQSFQAPAEQAAGAYAQAYAKYQAVAAAYPGTVQAAAAALGMAQSLFGQGKLDEAVREFGALDSGKASDPLAALAALGKARALEAQGKAAEALAAFQAAASRYDSGVAKAEAESAAVRLSAAPSGGTPKK